jgi:hypothetical protein
MTPADHARNNAISLEAKKDALAQRQNGDWKVSFTVQGIDMDTRLTQAPMGTRYAVVLVEIGDDELPAQQKEAPSNVPSGSPPSTRPDGTKRDWRDLPPPQRAGIRVGEALFAAFLREERPDDWHEAQDADDCLKLICGINSKRELLTNHKALVMFNLLDSAFAAWKAKERVGA